MSVASQVERQMLDLINDERAEVGAPPLELELNLNASAEDHSAWMIESDQFSHTGQDGSSPGDRMEAAEFDFSGNWSWGENIAWQSERGDEGVADDVASLHESLMNSPGHRENILNPDFEYIGIGVEQGDLDGSDAVVVSQNFASTDGSVEVDEASAGDEIADGGETVDQPAPTPEPEEPEESPETDEPADEPTTPPATDESPDDPQETPGDGDSVDEPEETPDTGGSEDEPTDPADEEDSPDEPRGTPETDDGDDEPEETPGTEDPDDEASTPPETDEPVDEPTETPETDDSDDAPTDSPDSEGSGDQPTETVDFDHANEWADTLVSRIWGRWAEMFEGHREAMDFGADRFEFRSDDTGSGHRWFDREGDDSEDLAVDLTADEVLGGPDAVGAAAADDTATTPDAADVDPWGDFAQVAHGADDVLGCG